MLRFASSTLRSTAPAFRRPLSTATHASSLSFKLSQTQPSPVFPRPLACCSPTSLLRGQLLVRGAASHVSGRPGSQTAAQAAQNIKEEVGHAGGDLAKAIAGGNVYSDSVAPTQDTFVSRSLLQLPQGYWNSSYGRMPEYDISRGDQSNCGTHSLSTMRSSCARRYGCSQCRVHYRGGCYLSCTNRRWMTSVIVVFCERSLYAPPKKS